MKAMPLFPRVPSVAGLTAALACLAVVVPARAFEIDILHDTNPPPQSDALLAFIDSRRPETMLRVGFNGGDIGEGLGDGRNEVVGVSFAFEPPLGVFTAVLSIEFTKSESGSETDNVSFADNNTPWGPGSVAYMNQLIGPLEEGVRHTIRVDMKQVPGRLDSGVFYDLSDLLRDGTLDVAFTDDSIVHSMRLQIETIPLPDLGGLVDLVRAAGLHHGIENALLAKIRAADEAMNRGDFCEARDSLGDFLSHVRAQRGKKISRADADAFSAMAREMLDALPDETLLGGDVCRSVNGGDEGDAIAGAALSPSAPNPFSASTEIRFEMFREERVDVAVFDVSGRRLRTIRSGTFPTGQHVETWDGHNDAGSRVVAGIYFVRLQVNGRVETDRVVLLRR